jgi:hypothetical protein
LDANHHNGFKQTDFLRSIPPIFLTLTSQGGNQGIAQGDGKKRKSIFGKFPPTFSIVPK